MSVWQVIITLSISDMSCEILAIQRPAHFWLTYMLTCMHPRTKLWHEITQNLASCHGRFPSTKTTNIQKKAL